MALHVDWLWIFNNIVNYSQFPKLKKGDLIFFAVLLQQIVIINVNYISTKMKEKFLVVQTC